MIYCQARLSTPLTKRCCFCRCCQCCCLHRWRQLLDEWSADALLSGQAESSTDLLLLLLLLLSMLLLQVASAA
jgi:hypothetical protein